MRFRIRPFGLFWNNMSKAEKTRQFIIERAALLFNRKGIAATSIRDIMETTNLAKGGVYGNFESKDEICLEAFNYLIGQLDSAIDRNIHPGVSAREKLFALLHFYEEILFRKDNGGCPILNFGVESADTHPVIRERVGKAIKASQERIARLVREGIAAGEFSESFDADIFAIKTFSMLEGGIMISRINGNNSTMKVLVASLRTEIEQNSL